MVCIAMPYSFIMNWCHWNIDQAMMQACAVPLFGNTYLVSCFLHFYGLFCISSYFYCCVVYIGSLLTHLFSSWAHHQMQIYFGCCSCTSEILMVYSNTKQIIPWRYRELLVFYHVYSRLGMPLHNLNRWTVLWSLLLALARLSPSGFHFSSITTELS